MRLFISAVFLFCCLNGFGQTSTNSILIHPGLFFEYEDIKGELKSVETIRYIAVKESGEYKKTVSNEIEYKLFYDDNNKIIKVISILNKVQPSDTISESYSISYKKDSTSLQKTYSGTAFLWGNINRKYFWQFDQKGNIKEYTCYENDSLLEKELATYNDQNKLEEFNYYDGLGNIQYTTKHRYDKNGNEIEYIYNSNKSYIKKNNIYNSNNQLIEKNEFNKNNEIDNNYTYRYDTSGRLIEENCLFNGKTINKKIISYNPKGEKIESTEYDRESNVLCKESFAYNKEGALIEHLATWNKYYDAKPLKLIEYYEYDSRGNWIKKIVTTVRSTTALPSEYSIIERKITYK
jgi:hypothetical protein